MSFTLDNDTTPAGLLVKTNIFFGKSILIGDYKITLIDFLQILRFVLRKSLLTQSKLLWLFWRYFNSIRTVKGYNYGIAGKRIRTFRLLTKLSIMTQIDKASANIEITHDVVTMNLSEHSNPSQLKVDTRTPMTYFVHIGEYSLSLYDFLFVMDYVFSNEDLVKNDPRRKFLRRVKRWECFRKYRNRT